MLEDEDRLGGTTEIPNDNSFFDTIDLADNPSRIMDAAASCAKFLQDWVRAVIDHVPMERRFEDLSGNEKTLLRLLSKKQDECDPIGSGLDEMIMFTSPSTRAGVKKLLTLQLNFFKWNREYLAVYYNPQESGTLIRSLVSKQIPIEGDFEKPRNFVSGHFWLSNLSKNSQDPNDIAFADACDSFWKMMENKLIPERKCNGTCPKPQ